MEKINIECAVIKLIFFHHYFSLLTLKKNFMVNIAQTKELVPV